MYDIGSDAFLGVFGSITGSHGSSLLVIPLIGFPKTFGSAYGALLWRDYGEEYGLCFFLFFLTVYMRDTEEEEELYLSGHEQPE
jgi:hypothetical protein